MWGFTVVVDEKLKKLDKLDAIERCLGSIDIDIRDHKHSLDTMEGYDMHVESNSGLVIFYYSVSKRAK